MTDLACFFDYSAILELMREFPEYKGALLDCTEIVLYKSLETDLLTVKTCYAFSRLKRLDIELEVSSVEELLLLGCHPSLESFSVELSGKLSHTLIPEIFYQYCFGSSIFGNSVSVRTKSPNSLYFRIRQGEKCLEYERGELRCNEVSWLDVVSDVRWREHISSLVIPVAKVDSLASHIRYVIKGRYYKLPALSPHVRHLSISGENEYVPYFVEVLNWLQPSYTLEIFDVPVDPDMLALLRSAFPEVRRFLIRVSDRVVNRITDATIEENITWKPVNTKPRGSLDSRIGDV